MQKFENMDVIAALEAIMHQNTAYYQSDFAYDIKMLREAARSDQPEDKLLLWLSRPSGTFCFRERDVLLKDTQAYNTWKFCGEQTHDRILAYAVELTGAANGTVQGNLYELDYQQHFQHIRVPKKKHQMTLVQTRPILHVTVLPIYVLLSLLQSKILDLYYQQSHDRH